MNKTSDKKPINRYKPDFKTGLSFEQVQDRVESRLTNKSKMAVGKSIWDIIVSNVLSFFNILLFIIAILMIVAEYYQGLLFLIVIIPNMVVGLVEDFKARIMMKKLRLLTAPKAIVIRNSKQNTINCEDVVLDDVLYLKSEMQIPVDGEIVSGAITVNESLLTGEPDNIEKNIGDKIFSGSYVVGGNCYARADVIGNDTYASQLQNKANKFSRSPSVILKSLTQLFRVIGILVIVLAALQIVSYAKTGQLESFELFKKLVPNFSASMISMIPSGLFLLTSALLAVTTIVLGKRGAQVQDFYSIEMLARSDVLCVDKTGTITDGTMSVNDFDCFDKKNKDSLHEIISALLVATGDSNLTSKALREYFKDEPKTKFIKVLPFNSDNKYSAATSKDGITYVIGAIEYINFSNKDKLTTLAKNYTSLGLRVMAIGSVKKGEINHGLVIGDVEPLGLIILEDHIREDAKKTFGWFQDNKVSIRVISGDDPQTVSFIAQQAGILNADKFVSLAGKSLEEVRELATKYVVFGRVTPEQKEEIIKAIKEEGHTVAMTGDGVNDILALKRSDCSIAMASGADAARNVSHIVLLDSDFATLPNVVAEGRKVVNNIQRTSSLYLVKTTFAIFWSGFFIISALFNGSVYPFSPNNMYMWEFISIGLASFFIALEPNKEKIEGKFFGNVFRKLIPGAFLMILPVLIFYFLSYVPALYHTPFYLPQLPLVSNSLETPIIVTLSVLSFTVCSVVYLLKLCMPLTKYRLIVVLGVIAIIVTLIVLTFLHPKAAAFFGINYSKLNPMHYVLCAAVTISIIVLYFVGNDIYDTIKEIKKDVKN